MNIIPVLVKIDFGALHEVRRHLRGVGVTLFLNGLRRDHSKDQRLVGARVVIHAGKPAIETTEQA